jgi:formamidopyrimidine-DNA glycosylase
MPELPEVETVMRGLGPVLEGAVIDKVQLRRKDLRIPFPKGLKRQLEGQRVISLKRRAKYIQIFLESHHVLIIHLGMSGRVSIVSPEEAFEPGKHDHFVLTLESGVRIAYNDPRRFGMIFIVPEEGLEKHPAFSHLGPEPLGNGFSGPVLATKLKNKKTSIKQALLDQKIVVGVGNIYACEALYKAGINPEKQARLIQGQKAEELVRSIRTVLNKAIKAGGSTLKDYRHTDGQLGYFQHQFSVYGKEKESCLACDCDMKKTGGIQRIVQSGRSTFYCPRKQK